MNLSCRIILVVGLVLWAGCSEKTPRLPQLAPTDVVVAFGDSLTYGTGAAAEESYPAVLSEMIGHRVVRAGVPGEISAQGLARLPAVLEGNSPRVVIVCLGGNDMLRKVPDAVIISNLRAMLKMLKDREVAAVLIGVPRPSLVTSAPEFYAEIAKEFGVPYEGKVVTSVLYSAGLKSDPIHPNAAGYRRIAEAIALLLRQAGAI